MPVSYVATSSPSGRRSISNIASAETCATSPGLICTELPLALELRELRLLGEDLVPTLLHGEAGQQPIPRVWGSQEQVESV